MAKNKRPNPRPAQGRKDPNPASFPALPAQVLAQYSAGHFAAAEVALRAFLASHPRHPQAWVYRGWSLAQLKRPQEAISCLEAALKLDGGQPEIWFELGNLKQESGQTGQARKCYRQALDLNPDLAEAWNNLGLSLGGEKQWDAAKACYERALACRADYLQARVNLGGLYRNSGQPAAAEDCFRVAARLDPKAPAPQIHLGFLYFEQGRWREAQERFMTAHRLAPEHPLINNNLGALLLRAGRAEEAEAFLRRAIRQQPDYADALFNLASALHEQSRLDLAEVHYRRALELRPDHFSAHRQLAALLAQRGSYAEALAHSERALRRSPAAPLARLRHLSLCPVVPQDRASLTQWRENLLDELLRFPPVDLQSCLGELATCEARPGFYLAYQGEDNRAIKEAYGRLFVGGEEAVVGRRTGEIRVGFVVTGGHESIFLKCCRGLLEHWDEGLSAVTVIAPAASMARLKAAVNNPRVSWFDLPPRLDQAASALAQAAFDVLYYWEIGSDSTNYFLPHLRLAPVQCTSWGTPDTTGIATVDYYLTWGGWECEGYRERYSERAVALERPPVCYLRPEFDSASFMARSGFGLDPERPFYLCPQNPLKIHPDFDDLLARLLEREPRAQLAVIAGSDERWSDLLQQRWRKTMGPRAESIRIFPRQSYQGYFNLVSLADAVLDTLHFSGGNTSFEILATGTPIVTLPGKPARSRFTHGCYQLMGVDDCIARDEVDYLDIVSRLGNGPGFRSAVRKKIAANRDALFEDVAAVKGFQEFVVTAALEARAEG